jgi:hypothetical protein
MMSMTQMSDGPSTVVPNDQRQANLYAFSVDRLKFFNPVPAQIAAAGRQRHPDHRSSLEPSSGQSG